MDIGSSSMNQPFRPIDVMPKNFPDTFGCEKEPIHIPGSIQPVGLLFSVDNATLQILQVSENCAKMLGSVYTVENLIGTYFTQLLPADQVQLLIEHLQKMDYADKGVYPIRLDFLLIVNPASAVNYEPSDLLGGVDDHTSRISGGHRRSSASSTTSTPSSTSSHLSGSSANGNEAQMTRVSYFVFPHRSRLNEGVFIIEMEPVPKTGGNPRLARPLSGSLSSKGKEGLGSGMAGGSGSRDVASQEPHEYSYPVPPMNLTDFGAPVQVNRIVLSLGAPNDLVELCKAIAKQMRQVTHFDRVMIYQFTKDFNGEVIVEEVAPGIPVMYLGLMFPHADIPPQARLLYRLNTMRAITDINAVVSRIMPTLNPKNNRPLDLTYSYYRSVSPVHLQYLRNMGVSSSFSVSILNEGQLWGMIACHHSTPIFMPYPIRAVCQLIGQLASTQLENLEHRSRNAQRLAVLKITSRPSSKNTDVRDLIAESAAELLDLFASDYAIVHVESEKRAIGLIPDVKPIRLFEQWIAQQKSQDLLVTDCITRDLPGLESTEDVSGVLHIPLSFHGRDYLTFFRKEQIQNAKWAGAPSKVINPAGHLEPRKSFQIWTELVRGKSREWTEIEVETAYSLQRVYSYFVEVWRSKLLALSVDLHTLRSEQAVLRGLVEKLKRAKENQDD